MKNKLIRLLLQNKSPHQIALGVAIGAFIAILPLYGLHTVLAILAVLLVRQANKIAILIGTNVSLPPTLPFITWLGYNLGRLVLGGDYPPMTWQAFKHFHLKEFMSFYYPLFVGSVIEGVVVAAILYCLTRWLAAAWAAKREARRKARGSKAAFILILAAGCLSILAPAFAQGYKGEKIVYAVSPIGKSEYNDLGIVDFNGQKLRLVTFQTILAGFNDLEKIYADPQTGLPLRVERYIHWLFSQEYLTEEYSLQNNTLVIRKFVKGKQVNEYKYKANGPFYNAILLPFHLRKVKDLDIGWSMTVRFPDEYIVTLDAIEEVNVRGKMFLAYRFSSTPHKFQIWVSKDAERIPVVIKGTLGYSMYLESRTQAP